MFTGCVFHRRASNQGSILFASLALLFIGALGLGALLSMTQQERRITDRAVVWKSALPVAEAGIEEAMVHLNSGSARGTNGWTFNTATGTFQKQRSFADGFFQAEISDSEPPVIRSRGFVAAQPHTNLLNRAVEVTTTSSALTGIIVKDMLKCGSGGIIDSYNSADPRFSTFGQYDPSKAKDTCLLASITNRPSCVEVGGRKVFGFVATGTGGSVSIGTGKVGSKEWVLRSDTGGKIEAGHYISGYRKEFPEIVMPIKNPWPPMKDVGGYRYMFSTGDYQMSKFSLGPKEKAIVVGKARLLVTGDFSTQGTILVKAGASLELYCAGSVKITAQGFINENGRCRFLKINAMGKGKTGEVSLQGSSDFIGLIYAPHAEVKITGSCRFFGSVWAQGADMTGNTEFHADEDAGEAKYMIASWQEIP